MAGRAKKKKTFSIEITWKLTQRMFIFLAEADSFENQQVSLSGQLNFCSAKLLWSQDFGNMRY